VQGGIRATLRDVVMQPVTHRALDWRRNDATPLSSAVVKARSAPSWSTVPPAAGGPAQRTRAPAQGRRIGHPFAHKRFGQLQDERAPVRQKLAVLRIARIVEDQVTRGEPVARYAREIRGTAQQSKREIALRGATDFGRTLDRACL
jgi:hypothetical protein